jgi:hypothetical protein
MTGPTRAALGLVTALIWAMAITPAAALALGPGSPLIPGAGQSNPLTPFTPPPVLPPTTTPAPTITPTTSTSGSGFSSTDGVAIGIGAMLVLGGISFFIWRDARKRAPVRQRAATAAAGGGSGPRQRQKPRKLSPAERKRRKRGRAR